MRAASSLVLALLLIAPTALGSTWSMEVLTHVDGELLAGTLGVGITRVDDGDPVPRMDLPPVSHAVHGFTLPECDRALHVQLDLASAAPNATVVQLEVHDANGSSVAAGFGGGRQVELGTDVLPTGDYTLHVYHLVGPPVAYNGTVGAVTPPRCAG